MTERSVLITGGSSGIGLATARRFAEGGHRVAVTFRTRKPPEDLLGVECDVNDPAAVEAAFKRVEAEHGPVEVLVCSAGVTADTLLMRMTADKLDAALDTNLRAPILMASRAARKMMTARFGRIIFIGSAVAMRGEQGQANYAASKAGLIGATRSIARELGNRGITANIVTPGLTATDMVTSTLSPDKVDAMVKQIPVPRIGQPEEVAAAVYWLAGDDTGYITGAIIPVDGGISMGH